MGASSPTILVAPTEPVTLRNIGRTSSLPERFGADVFWTVQRDARGLKVGVQRKEWKDLVASVEDGRWARELSAMRALDVRFVVVEGWPTVGSDGSLVDKRFGRAWNLSMVRSVLATCQADGVIVDRTANIYDTAEWCKWARGWTAKARHGSLEGREGVGRGMWGSPTNRDYGVHLLQGLPGVGPELAGRVYDHFGGVPWRWEVGVEELMRVEGIGRKKAEKMIGGLARRGPGWEGQ